MPFVTFALLLNGYRSHRRYVAPSGYDGSSSTRAVQAANGTSCSLCPASAGSCCFQCPFVQKVYLHACCLSDSLTSKQASFARVAGQLSIHSGHTRCGVWMSASKWCHQLLPMAAVCKNLRVLALPLTSITVVKVTFDAGMVIAVLASRAQAHEVSSCAW